MMIVRQMAVRATWRRLALQRRLVAIVLQRAGKTAPATAATVANSSAAVARRAAANRSGCPATRGGRRRWRSGRPPAIEVDGGAPRACPDQYVAGGRDSKAAAGGSQPANQPHKISRTSANACRGYNTNAGGVPAGSRWCPTVAARADRLQNLPLHFFAWFQYGCIFGFAH